MVAAVESAVTAKQAAEVALMAAPLVAASSEDTAECSAATAEAPAKEESMAAAEVKVGKEGHKAAPLVEEAEVASKATANAAEIVGEKGVTLAV
eukprot:1252598-Pleurochrysis_carterae.AAC.3